MLGCLFRLLGIDPRIAKEADLSVKPEASLTPYERNKATYARHHAERVKSELAPCPSCLAQMRAVPLEDLEVKDCDHCSGLWLGKSVLDKLCALPEVPQELVNPKVGWPRTKVDPSQRKCPLCRELLDVVDFEGVSVDRCKFCEGLWLDRGELHRVLAVRKKQIAEEQKPPPVCGFCNRENQKGAEMCSGCGAPLSSRPPG